MNNPYLFHVTFTPGHTDGLPASYPFSELRYIGVDNSGDYEMDADGPINTVMTALNACPDVVGFDCL